MFNVMKEIFFWSGIMGDHAEFFILNLSSREVEFIRMAQYYKNAFIIIQNEAKALEGAPTGAQTAGLVSKVIPLLMNFINFKRLAVRKLLQCDIELGLTPTLINHMINEAQEFYRKLCMAMSKAPVNPTAENILLHKIWLPDASGHAAAIAAELDPTETMLIKEAKDFKKAFDDLFIKAFELGQMLERTCLDDGSLQWLNKESEKKINEFICFLDKIRTLRLKCKAMGTIKPLFPDHMIREEKYYLSQIEALKAVRCLEI